ncbi:putative spermidine/putrescine transport system substrate-binding protein [Cetobacterium ceti]|uniref:Putative spermidine/putrescine transport system substrate-binding protein n=1 Tax=Cetobacterium ceti TaxID=180163 RepID=A0A1T4K2W5_9FUSO|nr:ABC transporter substrate-binding protein [Cetobacterium ceti]SJZ36617.1 putative spermidine/putrescine transport system substrate-binding protein [Cetobacterium ceti]
MKKILIGIAAMVAFVGCGKKEKTVNMYMWGGSQEINKFMDNVVAVNLEKKDNIKLNRVPITNIKDTVNKLIIEKQAGKKNGSIDLIWVNGENFKELKNAGVLEENIGKNLKNLQYVKESTLEKDFGEPINGYEIPWGEAQFNFIYRGNGNIPFNDSKTLMEYVKNNPGRFTYPEVNNFTGSAFVRNMAIDILGYENIEKMTNEELKNNLNIVWNYFNEMKPYLWREGSTYPESEGKLDTLYGNGEVDVTMGYTLNKVTAKIDAGQYDKNSKSFLLDKGTLFNNHYLAIPKNGKNKEDAKIVIDYLISPEGQLLKQEPENWGDLTILDVNKLDETTQKKFKSLIESKNLPSLKDIQEKRIKELSPEKLAIIEEGWNSNVGKI